MSSKPVCAGAASAAAPPGRSAAFSTAKGELVENRAAASAAAQPPPTLPAALSTEPGAAVKNPAAPAPGIAGACPPATPAQAAPAPAPPAAAGPGIPALEADKFCAAPLPAAPDPAALRRRARAYYARRPAAFLEDFVRIECVGREPLLQPFVLWPAQRAALRRILASPRSVILKARQLGLTWLVLGLAVWRMLTRPGWRVGAISRAGPEARELVRRLAVMLAAMPAWAAPARAAPPGWTGPVYTVTALEVRISWPDGSPPSLFRAFLSSPSAGRGFTFHWLILDEWAFHPQARALWTSLFPTANRPGAKVIGLSTMARGTLFEEIYTTPGNGFAKLFLPWRADPARTDAWYAATRAALGPEKTMQEYPASPAEALRLPGGQMFPEVCPRLHLRRPGDGFWAGPVRRYAAIDYGLDMFSCHWIAVNEAGRARVYREYDAPDLTIPAACRAFRRLTGAEPIDRILAPPDLWSRDQLTGRSRADLFAENGMYLTRVSSDFAAGVAYMKNWLRPDGAGGAWLTIEAAPRLYRCLQQILRDTCRPDVYAKTPHALTHDCDSLRYFCVYFIHPAEAPPPAQLPRWWPPDMRQDYEQGSEETRRLMARRFGLDR